jgi:hypothetical protein
MTVGNDSQPELNEVIQQLNIKTTPQLSEVIVIREAVELAA